MHNEPGTNTDTVVAIATPQGTGALSMVRLSGPEAIAVAGSIYDGRVKLVRAESHRAYHGFISSEGQRIDEVVVVVYRAPRSFTGEDLVEITCHGGGFVTKRILETMCDYGARLAEPGEFTKRAFLNGRIDLAQAEAVCGLIQARTEMARRSSMSHLQGYLSRRISEIREELVQARSLIELELDFADEDVEFAERCSLAERLSKISSDLSDLAQGYERGHILREGVRLVIAGKPNVGKSSLLNALLKTDRAIVTDVPGTTRDSIEEALDIGGVLFRVVDTAGFRQTRNEIEREGVRRTERQIGVADAVVVVLDVSEMLSEEDHSLIKRFLPNGHLGGSTEETPHVLIAVNKIDLPRKWRLKELEDYHDQFNVVEISAKEGEGLAELEESLIQTVLGDAGLSECDYLMTNVRHWEALKETVQHLALARQSLNEGLSGEFVAVDLRAASDSLGRIIGVVTDEEILNQIFSRFCIGK